MTPQIHKHGQLAHPFNFGVNMGEFMRNLCKEIAFNNSLQTREILHYIRRAGLISLELGHVFNWG